MVTVAGGRLGQRLRDARKALGLTQEEFGKLVGLSDSYVSQIENGNRRPTHETLMAIARGAGLDYEELARLAGFLPGGDEAAVDVEDPEIDLLFHQLKSADLSPTDLAYVKETIRTALRLRRERAERPDSET